jgi:hypothetical protein
MTDAQTSTEPSYPRARCRSRRCAAEIIWVTSTANNKPMPLDAEPTDDGTVVISTNLLGDLVGTVEPAATAPKRKSHFATCPDAVKFRKD